MFDRLRVGSHFAISWIVLVAAALTALLFITIQWSLATGAPLVEPTEAIVNYEIDEDIFANPERGFYHHKETFAGAYDPLNLAQLQGYRQNENMSLIFRLFYLDDFVTSPISQDYLDKMEADFVTLRQAGMKAVVRIAYTRPSTTTFPPPAPYGDATKDQILNVHLPQLSPILQRNSDVIAVVQAGFIGHWGEWFYTDHFANPNNPEDREAFWGDRAEVVQAILNMLPNRFVQLRTPLYKQKLSGVQSGAGGAITPERAFDGSDFSRMGHHNDCFLASSTDFGTYTFGQLQADREFLATDTLFLPMGGETCNYTPDDDPPTTRSNCPTALKELAEYHWSYLSADWHTDVLTSWQGICMPEIRKRLGYRFALTQGIYDSEVEQGKQFAIAFEVLNQGWAAPFNQRPVELILRHKTSGQITRIPLDFDPRFWLPGDVPASPYAQVTAPLDLAPGDYDVLLNLPDPDPALAQRPEYSIRLANKDVWEATTGFNRLLYTLKVTAAPVASGTYYVATDGNDANDGSMGSPWRTIQKAANTLQPGQTVLVRGGVYSEAVTVNVSGSAQGGFVTFRNFPGETPILDGTNLTVPADYNGLFLIRDKSYIHVEGFEIRNYGTDQRYIVPVGIHIRGAGDYITLRNNKIYEIRTTAVPTGQYRLGADAHGIAVYGTKAPDSLKHITIDHNQLYSLTLGSSEGLVLNGNVEFFTITDNLVRDSNNIAIDFIGFEGTSPVEALDQARDGFVAYNAIYNIDTFSNPSYGGDRSAGGIYVDGGTRIDIHSNEVFNCNFGVEIASEHKGKATSYIVVRNNLIHNNHIAGLSMGGYDKERGSTEHSWVINNTFYNNDTLQDGNGEIVLQFDTRNNVIANNIMQSNVPQSLLIGNQYTESVDNLVDYNLYFAPAGREGSRWEWKKVSMNGFDNYTSTTGNDTNSLFVDANFVNVAESIFTLQVGSQAIDGGTVMTQSGEYDHAGQARVLNGKIDIGAYEHEVVSSALDPQSGGSLTAPNQSVSLAFPPGAVDQNVSLSYVSRPKPPHPTTNMKPAGKSFSISAMDGSGGAVNQFSQPFNLVLDYKDEDWKKAGINGERLLNLFWWDGTSWKPILPCNGCSLDTVNNKLTARLDHLTDFALLGGRVPLPADPEIYLPAVQNRE